MPGIMFAGQNATCSVSAKKLSGQRSSTIVPIICSGTSSSGISLVASRWSNGNSAACSSVNSCTPRSQAGKSPAWIASNSSRRWKSLSACWIFMCSSQMCDCTPSCGRQWNFTNVERPSLSTKRKVWMPKPSIIRRLRGRPRSDSAHMVMCQVSGVSETKSQKVSCALEACGKARSGSIFTAWTKSGNFMASWMAKIGKSLPTRSKLPSWV